MHTKKIKILQQRSNLSSGQIVICETNHIEWIGGAMMLDEKGRNPTETVLVEEDVWEWMISRCMACASS
jgi:hypothetical protein